jgi:hypothetical protein
MCHCTRGDVFVALLVTLLVGFTQASQSDCEALAATGWAPITDWTVNSSIPQTWCCAYQNGITCDVTGAHVIQLVLPNLNLAGAPFDILDLYARDPG